MALDFLIAIGFDFDKVYNGRAGIVREQLTILNKAKFLSPKIVDNARTTILRLEKSKNKSKLNFDKSLKNTIVGTLSSSISQELASAAEKSKDAPKAAGSNTVQWLPSKADEQRPYHALNYGKIMPLETAVDRGLGVDYGCQCGMRFISKPPAKIQKVIDKINAKN